MNHTIDHALKSHANQVIVVLGYENQRIQGEIENCDAVKIIVNPEWSLGMGNSVKYGVRYVQRELHVDFAILTVCDQPFIHAEIFNELMMCSNQNADSIIVCTYADGTRGVPVLFPKRYFVHILSIPDTAGAKSVWSGKDSEITGITFKEGAFDIDTPSDVEKLLRRSR